jgi:mannose-6-phosphate isomerase
MKPLPLPPNVLHHFYAGGARIARLRGMMLDDDHAPEEWLGATTTSFDGTRGLSRLEDGTLVRDAVAADPEAFLGADHVARFGPDPGLLVKLLDAGQRLPVHFHPGRAFARRTLGSPHGKTEAWIIVETVPGASVHVGFADAVDLATVREWMRAQDAAAMLAAMRERPVAAGDAIFVPAGVPHAIGEGILLVELQEPTDLSVLLEWEGFELGEDDGHLGLGWDVALDALDTSGWDDEQLSALAAGRGDGALLPSDADPYFRAERVRGGDVLDPGFTVLVGIAGEGALGGEPFGRGAVVLVPHAAGPVALDGDVEALRCRPADPAAGEPPW